MPLKVLCYLALMLSVSTLGIFRWKRLAPPTRIVAALICLATVAESTAFFCSIAYGNSLPVYHFYSPVEFTFICMYFNSIIPWFKQYGIGMILGALGISLSVVNTVCFQELWAFNSNFLLFEATVIIVCCQLHLRAMFLAEEILPYRHTSFWITMCLIFFWSTTFTSWGIYALPDTNDRLLNPIMNTLLYIVNYVFYFAMGAIFLLDKKLIPSRA